MTVPRWTGEAVKRMHLNRISINELAAHMGHSRQYISGLLNGKMETKGARFKVMAAIDTIIEERGMSDDKTTQADGDQPSIG